MGNSEAIGAFPATSWSLIGRVASGDAADSRRALGVLLEMYLPALRARLIVDRRVNPNLAQDVLQGFVADKILAQELISRASRERGKFRSFVLTALDRYLIDRLRGKASASRNASSMASEVEQLPAPGQGPCDAFVREWARQLVAQAVKRMEAECAARNRPDLWALFRGRLLECGPDGAQPAPYGQFMAEFGFTSVAQASNALVTAKRMFLRCLRSVVAEYIEDPAQIDAEIADIRAALEGT
ncbi:MAG TPA: hypothetical protein VN541_22660 [Tepidisphaeraceae bacterium]|nr:hypothetical protein [Tepidisphaeraceae bacterium]